MQMLWSVPCSRACYTLKRPIEEQVQEKQRETKPTGSISTVQPSAAIDFCIASVDHGRGLAVLGGSSTFKLCFAPGPVQAGGGRRREPGAERYLAWELLQFVFKVNRSTFRCAISHISVLISHFRSFGSFQPRECCRDDHVYTLHPLPGGSCRDSSMCIQWPSCELIHVQCCRMYELSVRPMASAAMCWEGWDVETQVYLLCPHHAARWLQWLQWWLRGEEGSRLLLTKPCKCRVQPSSRINSS